VTDNKSESGYYLRQGGYVFFGVCLSVCLLATLHRNFQTDLREIFREGLQWAIEQMIKFWWRSGSHIRIQIWIRIVTTVKRALAEVCTVPMLLIVTVIYTLYCSISVHICAYGS